MRAWASVQAAWVQAVWRQAAWVAAASKAVVPHRGSSVRRGRSQAEARHRTTVPEEVFSVLAAVVVLAVAVLGAGLVAALAVLGAGLVVLGAVALAVVAVAVGPTVLTTVRLVPHESRDPACFLASRS